MRNILKKTVGSISFMCGLLALLILLSNVFIPKNNDKKSGMDDVTANGILAEKENTVDVLIIGDSESYSAVVPMKLWQNYGFTSYVCGTPGQKLSYSEEFLHKAIKKQTPKIVILEAHSIYQKASLEDHLQNKAERVLPVFRYHNRWKSLKSSDFVTKSDYTYIDYNKGYRYKDGVKKASTNGYMKKTDNVREISLSNQVILKNLKRICDEVGAELIIVSVPSTINWNYAKHNGVQQSADKIGVEYIDMNLIIDKVGIDWNKDTRDKGDHMNHSGALKVTEYIGKILSERAVLEDHRSDSRYSDWDVSLERYLNKVEKKNKK